MAAIETILGIETLTGVVANPANGVPVTHLPPAFLSTRVSVPSVNSSYHRVTHVRKTAPLTDLNSPSKSVDTPNAGKVSVTLATSLTNISIGPELFMRLNDTNGAVQERAIAEVGRRSIEHRRLHDNTRISFVNSMLATGRIYFNGAGELLPNSSNSAYSVDYSVPANNLNNTGIGAWNTSSTDIIAQIEDEKVRLQQLTGLTFRHCIYGKNIPGYLVGNDDVTKFINNNPALQNPFAQRMIPNGLLDLTWWRGNDMWYEDATGTMRNWCGDNTIILFPEPSSDWYEIQEAPYLIPNDQRIFGSIEAAVTGGFTTAPGMFSYAYTTIDPGGAKQVVGDIFLPVLKVPGALRIVTDVTQAAT